MSDSQQVAPREKQEVSAKDEQTVPGRFYTPATDIYETDEALTVVMEIPGVDREHVNYTEYGVGNYARSFELSNKVDRNGISAEVTDGVLTLTLPKIMEAEPRRIPVS
jgi:HSP20 family protein